MGFRGVDVEDEGNDTPAPVRPRSFSAVRDAFAWRDIAWRRLAIVLLYLTALVGAGALLARRLSSQAGAALVVGGLILLVVAAFRSRNRGGDAGLDAGTSFFGSGGWDVGGDGGGDGGGGGGD